MCGRFVGNFSTSVLLDEIRTAAPDVIVTASVDLAPETHNFNTAPTQECTILVAARDGLELRPARWGLVPVWSKDASVASKMINARSETLTEKPSFRGLVPSHRAIVPMSGFYEWDRHDPKNKRPFFVPRRDARTMWAAALWTRSPALGDALTFSVVTRPSLADLSAIHDRSPVQLDLEDGLEWVLAQAAPLELLALTDQPALAPVEIGKAVNSVRNNGPTLVEPLAPGEPDTLF